MRYIYEFLIISKYVAVSKDVSLYNRWDSGKGIWMSSDVLKKIVKPNVTEIKTLWETLCGFTHSSITSQQSGIEYSKYDEKEIKFNYVIIWVMMEMSIIY